MPATAIQEAITYNDWAEHVKGSLVDERSHLVAPSEDGPGEDYTMCKITIYKPVQGWLVQWDEDEPPFDVSDEANQEGEATEIMDMILSAVEDHEDVTVRLSRCSEIDLSFNDSGDLELFLLEH